MRKKQGVYNGVVDVAASVQLWISSLPKSGRIYGSLMLRDWLCPTQLKNIKSVTANFTDLENEKFMNENSHDPHTQSPSITSKVFPPRLQKFKKYSPRTSSFGGKSSLLHVAVPSHCSTATAIRFVSNNMRFQCQLAHQVEGVFVSNRSARIM